MNKPSTSRTLWKSAAVCAALFLLASTAAQAQFLTNGDFEAAPIGSGTTVFPGWANTSGTVSDSPVIITGSHSAKCVLTSAGYLRQSPSDPGGLLTNFIFECDFACATNSSSRTFQLNLYHNGTAANINLIIITNAVRLISGSSTANNVLKGVIDYMPDVNTVHVNHLKIVGRYTDPTPNYDVIITNNLGSNAVLNQTFFQNAAPSGTNDRPTLISFECGNLASGGTNILVVDNVSLTNSSGGSGVHFAATISSQPTPTNLVVLQGYTNLTIAAGIGGDAPLSPQWQFNGVNINPAVNPSATNNNGTNSTLSFTNVTPASAGNYDLHLTNAYGGATSSVVTLTVSPVLNTSRMSNVWTLLPGQRPYLTNTGSGSSPTERGMAYNPVSSNLLLASRAGSTNMIVALDPSTGAQRYFLNTGNLGAADSFSSPLNEIGVADDGVVYAANVTTQAGTANFILYQWSDDSTNSTPSRCYTGDPGDPVAPNMRWGDNMAVRGAGVNTQILLAPGSGTNIGIVALMTTPDGFGFNPTIITVAGVSNSAFAEFGLAFGPGTNTFWAKGANQQLQLVQFDPNSGTGTLLDTYSTNSVLPNSGPLGANAAQNLLAVLTFETPDDVRLYDVSNPSADPVLLDQKLFPVKNPNAVNGLPGAGAVIFAGNQLFVLDSNNGIQAFQVNTNQSLATFPLTIQAQPGGGVLLTWQSVSGHNYQVQYKNNLTDAGWTNLGSQITASSTSTSTTDTPGTTRFYRIQGQ
jgi:hypothetical protein